MTDLFWSIFSALGVVAAGSGAVLAWLQVRHKVAVAAGENAASRSVSIPTAIIAVAVGRLPVALRQELAEEWIAELAVVLHEPAIWWGARTVRGARFAFGLLCSAGTIARELRAGEDVQRTESVFGQWLEQVSAGRTVLARTVKVHLWSVYGVTALRRTKNTTMRSGCSTRSVGRRWPGQELAMALLAAGSAPPSPGDADLEGPDAGSTI